MANAINWFEIPVADMDRAQRFYEVMLARALRREQFGDQNLAVFPYEEPAAGGCLQASPDAGSANGHGVRIYLDCEPSIDAALSRAKTAGGGIVVQKTALPPGMGYFAHVRDTEGNVVGLHALK
ncbi:MAG: VOC family protein [Proteobacteria bacterium]|nr:VOC family protein [Pseudomonadota bacterium]